jgi:threonine dehydrogenase-like Zn-dependent dehydrogenase
MQAVVFEADWEPRSRYRITDRELQSRKARVASEVYRHPRFVRRNVPDPTPGPGEVVVQVGACGVCGSDTHCYESDADGYILFSGPVRLPCICGHEYTGRVVATGAGVRHLRPGDLVASEGMLYCGVCEACRRGQFNQCPDLEMVGFSSPGAYADLIAVHEKHLWRVNALADRLGSEVDALERAATVEPIACAFNGIWVSGGGMRPGSHVVVYGCGPIGLGAILLCRAAGAASVTAFDVVPERVALARACGADVAYDTRALAASGASPADVVLERTRGWGADVQVEAAGAAKATMPEIERAFAPGGMMVYLGRTGDRAPVELDRLVTGAARIVGARGHAGGGCFPNLLRMLESGARDPRPMISARMGLHEAIPALERSTSRKDGKIMLLA